mgnify:CR=1 FL=1|jgi:hypothetical protein
MKPKTKMRKDDVNVLSFLYLIHLTDYISKLKDEDKIRECKQLKEDFPLGETFENPWGEEILLESGPYRRNFMIDLNRWNRSL